MGTSDGLEEGAFPQEPFARAWLRSSRTRRAIFDALGQRPGLHLSELAREVGVHISTLDYHVGTMEAIGVVEIRDAVRGTQTLCFLAPDATLWQEERTRALFGGGDLKHVANFLVENPGRTIQEIAHAMSMSVTSVRHKVEILLEESLVHRERVGQPYAYAAEPVLEAWSKEVGQAYGRPWEEEGGPGSGEQEEPEHGLGRDGQQGDGPGQLGDGSGDLEDR